MDDGVGMNKALNFDEHAQAIAKRQYFLPTDNTVYDMFQRVAEWVAKPEKARAKSKYTKDFYNLMASKNFCPGGRVLAGAGTQHGNVLNCFVQDGSPEIVASNEWVLHLATKLALVTKVGGGNGLNLDPIAPKSIYNKKIGQTFITIADDHSDFEKVKTGTYMDLVHGEYTVKGYRIAKFVRQSEAANIIKIKVGDSVEGIWQAASEMIPELLAGKDVLLDLSELRAEGTAVNGSGGSSSGPSSFAVEVFDNFAFWASLGAADFAGPVATLRYIFAPTLRVIRQGGTRRGAGMATMSIANPDIVDFVTSKDLEREQKEGDISTFNISVLVDDAFMQKAKEEKSGALLDIANHAWQTGEPGLIFIDRINQFNPMREAMGDIKATNPCVTADTWVSTHLGPQQVKNLIDKKFCAVVDGKNYSVESNGFFFSGIKQVYKLKTKRGYELKLTGNHKLKKVIAETRYLQKTDWLELDDLKVGDKIILQNHRNIKPWIAKGSRIEGWLLGSLVGDGTFITNKAKPMAALDFWGSEKQALADFSQKALENLDIDAKLWISNNEQKIRLSSVALAELAAEYDIKHGAKTLTNKIEEASYEFYQGFLSGLFDADGSVQGNQEKGLSIRLAQSDLELLQRTQRMLARLGIMSTIYPERRPAGKRLLPDGQGGQKLYDCRVDHELVISNDNIAVFQDLVAFVVTAKDTKLVKSLAAYERKLNKEKFSDEIVSIEAIGQKEVFDVTVEDVHAFDANGIAAHNCGEIPLYAGEPCDLGAINLSAYVTSENEGLDGFDFKSFETDTKTAIRFLDNVLEVNHFALDDNHDMSMKMRRLGLGIMGLADALIKMGYRYNSELGRKAVAKIINNMREAATAASEKLAKERGEFSEFSKTAIETKRRNVAVLTVAPTGTTSMLMGVSSGVEPVFAPFVYRKIGDSYASLIHPLFKDLLEKHEAHPDYAKDGSWDWDKVVEAVQAEHGSVQGLSFIPADVKNVLVCAHDISPEDHVKMQGIVQTSFDAGGKMLANSISKTINMPNSATVDDVYKAYKMAFETGCKGVTVYRDGSRQFQVLSTSEKEEEQVEEKIETPAANHNRLPGEPLFDRPSRLSGFTDTVKLITTSGEKRGFYITVNTQDGLPTELFINSGRAGDEANADSEALGRLVSIALQYGVPAEALVHTLRGISGGMYGTYQGRMVASKADIIAVALETSGVKNTQNEGQTCPDCGAPLRFEEGCRKCESCGFSKCG